MVFKDSLTTKKSYSINTLSEILTETKTSYSIKT